MQTFPPETIRKEALERYSINPDSFYQKLNRFGRRLYNKTLLKWTRWLFEFAIRHPNVVSIATLVVAFVVTQAVIGTLLAVLVMLVIVIHELGHYVVALHYGIKVRAPIFISLGFIIAGWVVAEKVNNSKILGRIAFAGPMSGFVASAGILSFGLLTANSPVAFIGAVLAVYQGLAFIIGSDARHMRTAWKENHEFAVAFS